MPVKIRFAPSPTGHFHLGNLRTAYIAGRLAQVNQLLLHLRFEDIDDQRCRPEFVKDQMNDLRELGISWSEISFQKEFFDQHFQAFKEALTLGDVYPCFCSRREVLEDLQRAPNLSLNSKDSAIQPSVEYSGKCRTISWEISDFKKSLSKYPRGWGWRFRSQKEPQGKADFLIGRTLGPSFENWTPSYNWACAWDDFKLQNAILVRAWDLDSSEKIQKELRDYWTENKKLPNSPQIASYFTSLVVTESGKRLEKRDKGLTLKEIKRNMSSEKIVTLLAASWHGPSEGLVQNLRMIGESFGETSKFISVNEVLEEII